MGRYETGVYTTMECKKLDIRWLLKVGYIVKNAIVKGQMSWTGGSTSGFESKYTNIEKWLRMSYIITDRRGNKTELDYTIQIIAKPSNLGKGEIPYFVCPESGKLAKILFMAYGHHKYLHRDWYLERYNLRLYYRSQQASKDDYNNTMFFNLKKRIDVLEKELNKKHRKRTYNGKPTKEYQKLNTLKQQQLLHDTKRVTILKEKFGVKYLF